MARLRLGVITAPEVIDGAMDGAIFTLYAEHSLALTFSEGDIVILDNLPAHKAKRARDVIKAAGAILLFLPPYSPDFTPIKQAFAEIKAFLSKAARTVEALETANANALKAVTPDECLNQTGFTGEV